MTDTYSPQSRTERLIASGRVVLAASSLIAIWLDPLQPAQYAEETYGLMVAYVVYSVLLALLVWSARVAIGRIGLVTHVVDLLAFSLFMVLTDGPPTSPFFVYFLFAILCATLRWGWVGTLWTAAVSLTAVLALGVWAGYLDDERLNRFIIRSVYLAVIAVMLGYLGAYERQVRGEIARLAAWPRPSGGDVRDVVRDTLAHAARVLNAPRVAMAWDEPEEPWLNLVTWSAEGMTWEREAPGRLHPLVPPELETSAFFCVDAASPKAVVVVHAAPGGPFRRWHGAPLHAELRARHRIQAVLSLPVAGETYEARLFFLDKRRMNLDDLVLARVVAEQVGARLDHAYLQQRLKRAAVMEERIRFARDLHDGLLQSLTGTALRLQAVHGLLRREPEAALDQLAEIQRIIAAEQRSLRSYIRELRPAALLASRADTGLATAIRGVAERVERQWGLRVHLRVNGAAGAEAASLVPEICHLVHEALVNAARHGAASAARVLIEERDAQVVIAVADNGRGFPFRGRYDLRALDAMGAGPRSLKERVTALGGTLELESTEEGARLEISLPLAESRV